MFDITNFEKFSKSLQNLPLSKYTCRYGATNLNSVISLESDGLIMIKKGKHSVKIKPGKLCPEEGFTNTIKAYLRSNIAFKIMRGRNSCKYFYQYGSLEKSTNTLRYDCMRYKECQSYFGIVRQNPKQISILYAFREDVTDSSNNVCGFALLFTDKNGITYYDRIYGYDNVDTILIEKYCIENGYSGDLWDKPGFNKKIYLDKWKFKKYPYMDSFSTLNIKTGELHTRYEDSDEYIRLRGMNGNFDKV